MTDENMINMTYMRAKVFYKKKIKVHISLKNGTFYNGLITETNPNFLFLDDQKEGRQLIFFSELAKPIAEYKEESSNGNGGIGK